MNLYRFYWRDGSVNEGIGRDVADAYARLGFGRGALPALDYHKCVSKGVGLEDVVGQSQDNAPTK